MQPFIRVAEIWKPDATGAVLDLGAGLYGDLHDFAAYSRTMTFRSGEGLPGRAWAERHPVIMGSFTGSTFRRTEAAAAVGLTSGIALPIFGIGGLKAVVTFLCSASANYVGAVEAWMHDPDEGGQIRLHDGHYGNAELFERTSRMTQYGRGYGLPGAAWESGMPVVMPDLFRTDRFLRRDEEQKAGSTFGIALPFDDDPPRTWVMTFLSALGTPIAGRFEVWTPDEAGSSLVYATGTGAEDAGRPSRIAAGEGLLGRVLSEAFPRATERCGHDTPWLVDTDNAEARQAIATPLLAGDGRVKAVVVWRL